MKQKIWPSSWLGLPEVQWILRSKSFIILLIVLKDFTFALIKHNKSSTNSRCVIEFTPPITKVSSYLFCSAKWNTCDKFSITMLNSIGDRGSPWRRPLPLRNCSVDSPSISREKDGVVMHSIISFTSASREPHRVESDLDEFPTYRVLKCLG